MNMEDLSIGMSKKTCLYGNCDLHIVFKICFILHNMYYCAQVNSFLQYTRAKAQMVVDIL